MADAHAEGRTGESVPPSPLGQGWEGLGCRRPCCDHREGRSRESYSPLCPLDISPKYDGGAVEFGGELAIEICYEH